MGRVGRVCGRAGAPAFLPAVPPGEGSRGILIPLNVQTNAE